MSYVIGAVLAVAVGVFATRTGLDRDRAFYPVVGIVIAGLYVLFAAIGASPHALVVDGLVGAVFAAAALLGFKRSLWIVVAVLAGHGILDAVHANIVANPGVPPWWPGFCLAYDVMAAAYLAWLLGSRRVRAVA